MSETRIVNRFPITAGLDRDLKEIDQATEVAGQIVNEAVDSISTASIPPSIIKTHAEQFDRQQEVLAQVGKSATELAASGDIVGALTKAKEDGETWTVEDENGQSLDISQTDMNTARALSVALTEIASLRASVIRAFKHMGIDTRKFFS